MLRALSWSGLRQAVLFDYPSSAAALWLAIVGAGVAALAWALWALCAPSAVPWPATAAALALVALASTFAMQIPRSKYSLSVADVFVFIVLAALGTPAAVLAAGLDAAIGTTRTSRRLSSRISSPAAAMAAMAVCGLAFEAARSAADAVGLDAGPATLAALCAVGLVPLLLTMVPLVAMMRMKGGAPLWPPVWVLEYTGFGAVALGSALLAGLLQLNALRYGPSVLGLAGLAILLLVLLVRVDLRRRESERQSQDRSVALAERQAAINQQRFIASFTHAAIGMAIERPQLGVVQVNDAMCQLFGRTPPEILGRPIAALFGPAQAQRLGAASGGHVAPAAEIVELELTALDGALRWVEVHCGNFDDPEETGRSVIYQFHDVSLRRRAENRLQHIAFHDDLTGLANRSNFREQLEAAVECQRRTADHHFAVMFLDLDRFKLVNDSLGHNAGNQLLRAVAATLRAGVRHSDVVARLGGDEFAVLLSDIGEPEVGLQMAQRLLETLRKPVLIMGNEVLPEASIGLTFSDLGSRSVDEVLRDADLAMYEAKAGGRCRVVVFDGAMHERAAEKLALEADLRHAIGEGQLSLVFQPLFQLEPLVLCGFEALARWTHPQRGPVNPAVFFALAEESGYVGALTDWVIEEALSHLTAWLETVAEGTALDMHINISGHDLMRTDFVDHVRALRARYPAAAQHITLEITETTLMRDLKVALETIEAFRELGIRFSVDDFGTGYSSLAYLSRLPIESLKIDRSFVAGMSRSPEDVEIVRAICGLGRSLGKKVIAEGIETVEQLQLLRQLGAEIGQGFLLSRPLAPPQAAQLLCSACEKPLLMLAA
jgi:diguanylate cyclase (GGDEF)-like protein/PAS domain S-box-containing protein